jgi:hypothetical protein
MKITCVCPEKGDGSVRHPDGDEITLRDKLDFHAVTTIRWESAVLRETDPGAALSEYLAAATENYVLFGIEAWTIVDAKGKPVEVTKPAIRQLILGNAVVGQLVGDEADNLYGAVMRPLLNPALTSSPPTPTAESTSPTTASSAKRQKPPSRSSITTIPTAGTEVTSSSLDGDSSSSPNSVSAA